MPLIEYIFNPISSFHHKRILNYLKKLNIEKVVDVGAHKGEFIEVMMQLKNINSFYAFEPQKDIFEILSKKFSENKKISLHNFALDKEIRSMTLQVNKLSMTSSLAMINQRSLYLKVKNFLTNSGTNFIDKYEVQTNTMDEVFKNLNLEKTLLKIDVEGFEINVIKGSKTKLKEIPFILIENQFGNHYQNNSFDEVKEILLKEKFIILKKFIFPTMHYQDVLFKKI